MPVARSRQRNMRAIGCMQAHLGNSNAKPTIADIMRRSDQFFGNQLPQKIAGALFGIKINLEMLFLVDEILKQKGNSITITYGKPIDPSTLDKSKTDDEWAYEVKKQVYELVQ